MRRLLVPLFTGLALVAGPVVLAAPASAETLVITDAKKDVRAFDMENGGFGAKEPGVRDHDIVRSRINHGPKALTIRVKHRSLTGPKFVQGTSVRILTSKGEEYSADWYRFRGMGKMVELTDENGESVDCKMTATNAPKKALRTLRVPRSCIGEPAWVRVNPVSLTGRGERLFADSGLGDDKRVFNRLSPRVRVG